MRTREGTIRRDGRCCLCLWLSVFVESALECQVRVCDVICAAALNGTMRSAMSVLLEKPSLWRQRRPLACGAKHCPLEHPMAACPRPIHAGFCGNGQSRMLHELRLELVPQKVSRVRLKLDCAVQHCLVVFISKPASVRRRVVQEH